VNAPENTVRRELVLPHPRAQVWKALTTREILAEWMYPNDFEPRVGHRFTFRVPPKPEVNFEGLTVECEVLVCKEPELLEFSWSAGAPVVNTRVTFRMETDGQDGTGTRLLFEHSGFDLDHPFGKHALKGAEFGWKAMLEKLAQVLSGS
jgi:uncharacterized protein YndB with AHSA1/START domain